MDELNEQESEFERLLANLPCDDRGRAEHRESLRERVLAAFDAARARESASPVWKRAFNHGREIMRRPLPRLIAAAAACLAVVGVWLLVPGQESTARAFNMFAEALVGARSATFEMEVKIEGQGTQKVSCSYLEPGKVRNDVKGIISVMDSKAGKIVSLDPKRKTAMIMNLQNVNRDPGKPQLYDIFDQTRDLLSKARDGKGGDFNPLGEKEIDGHRAIGFSVSSPLQAMTLWGDPATGLPVQIETVWSGIPRTESKMSHFALNAELKPELFNTTPPADYKVQSFDVDASKPTEATLVEALRLAADLNDGKFIDNFGTASVQALIIKQMLASMKDKQQDKPKDITTEMMQTAMNVGRGLMFALELPDSADAHYAGKGVKRGEPDRPIFWYKPEGANSYRVIYADLSAKDAEQAPDVAGAVRLEKVPPKPAGTEK